MWRQHGTDSRASLLAQAPSAGRALALPGAGGVGGARRAMHVESSQEPES
jgi:hypothetical protein